MVFVPRVSSPARRGLVFALAGQSLHVAIGASPKPSAPMATSCSASSMASRASRAAAMARRRPAASRSRCASCSVCSTTRTSAVAGRAPRLSSAWDRDHRFCGRCGGSDRAGGGRARPRVHAGAASACTRGSRWRLSRSSSATAARCSPATRARRCRSISTLAGFVELGETLEECSRARGPRRGGHRDRDVRYFGSQPWPFPAR